MLGSLRVAPVLGPTLGLSLGGPSGVGLGLRALRWFGLCGWHPVSSTVRLLTEVSAGAPGLFRSDADTSPFESELALGTATLNSCVCWDMGYRLEQEISVTSVVD